MLLDLFSPDYFVKKLQSAINTARPDQWEPWDVARERFEQEKLKPLLDQYRLYDHNEFKEFHRRRGEVMHSSDLILRLQEMNPHIFVQQQYNFPDDWGLYADVLGTVQYLSAVPKGWLTEFSYSIVDEHDLPSEERRGWRTILVLCMMKGALEWADVEREFGDPQDGFNARRWYEAVKDFRWGGEQISQRNQSNLLDT